MKVESILASVNRLSVTFIYKFFGAFGIRENFRTNGILLNNVRGNFDLRGFQLWVNYFQVTFHLSK